MQSVLLSLSIICLMMNILPIATQIPLTDFINCDTFWIIQGAFGTTSTLGGFGMAVYRFLSMKYKLTSVDWRKSIVRKIIIFESLVTTLFILTVFFGSSYSNQQKSIFHQFCRNANPEMMDILSEYQNPEKEENTTLWYFRVSVLFIFQCLMAGELSIYFRLVHDMWKHDTVSLIRNIITPAIRQERKRKNIITLEGQISCFIFKLSTCTFFIVTIVFNVKNAPSLMPFFWISCTSLISVSELLASHELREYLYYKLFA